MSMIKIVCVLLLSCFCLLEAEMMYEDATSGTTEQWSIRDNDPLGASIANVWDTVRQSQVIAFSGTGTRNSYMIGDLAGANAWDNQSDRVITWKMNFSEEFVFYVSVQTTSGHRYLFYTSSFNRGLLHNGGIHHGLGRINGWRTITRDLDRDLKDAEPDNDIISINGLIVRGSGRIDDIMLYTPFYRIYEQGESGTDGWRIHDNTPEGATVTNIWDADLQGNHRQGNVIRLEGSGFDNAYILGDVESANGWNNRSEPIVQWRFRGFGSEPEILEERRIEDINAFCFTVHVDTDQGYRQLDYTLGGSHRGIEGEIIHHTLGDDRTLGFVLAEDDPRSDLGLWQTVTRDIEADIQDFEPTNHLIAINGFEVRNSGLVDDIKTLSREDIGVNLLQFGTIQAENVTEVGVDIRAAVSDVCQLQIEYGQTTAYGQWTSRENSFQWSTHLQRIRDLQPNMTYHYRVHAWDQEGHEVISADLTFATEGGNHLIIESVQTEEMTEEGVNIRAIVSDFCQLQVEYGETTAYGQWTSRENSFQWSTHLQRIRGLEPNTTYHYRVHAWNVEGLETVSPDQTFTTLGGGLLREDAEDGTIEGWSVYDNTPAGATIINVMDAEKGGRVIEVHGEAYNNGFMLGNRNGVEGWGDTASHQIQWSMNYTEGFVIYIPLETTNGLRYMVYTSENGDRGLNGEYIRIGLGGDAADGTWQTFTQNVAAELERYEPGNVIEAMNGFMIRGSGRLDDIQTIP